MLTNNLHKKIQLVLDKLKLKSSKFSVWLSRDVKNGHCYSNIVLVATKINGLSSQQLASQITTTIKKIEPAITKVVFLNGFLNFFFHHFLLNAILEEILQKKENFGCLNMGQNQLISYEWVSANPTGYLHIGHARNIFVGYAIANILSFVGYKVVREFYINDHGNQILQLGKTIFYHYHQLLGQSLPQFSTMYQNPEVITVAKKIINQFGEQYLGHDFAQNTATQKFFIQFSKDFFLSQMKTDLNSWNIKFDCWFSEASLYQGDTFNQFLQKLRKHSLTYSKDGALWFKTDNRFNAEDFVLVKSDGSPTYFSGDVMYHDRKFSHQYQMIVDLFGSDHHHHYLKIKSGLAGLGHDVSKFQVDLLQMVKMVQDGKSLKISKRAGNVIYLRDLVEMIDLNFLKFMLMFRQRTTKFVFDLTLVKKKSAHNPLFYTQYAYARSCQILVKIDNQLWKPQEKYDKLTSEAEQNLILGLHHFSSVLQMAAIKREPQLLVAYALELSKKFHSLYEKVPILNADFSLQQERLHLVFAFQQVLQNTLKLLGISSPKQM